MHRLKLTYTDCRIEVIKRMREQYIYACFLTCKAIDTRRVHSARLIYACDDNLHSKL